ncbi:MAG: polyphosphate polymerase domain-containing protein [Christensenellales bacterium]
MQADIQYDDGLVFRHELKYLITPGDARILKQRLGALLSRDENVDKSGAYKVRSVYFDDYNNSAYEEKMMGVASRKKYRIRVYNDSDAIINLERKTKRGRYVSKQHASLSRGEAQMILSGDCGFLLKNPQRLCGEFYYEYITKILRPRVIVDYDREPYVCALGDVRITFDIDVRAALLKFDLFDSKLPAINVLDPGQIIMEVKYTEFLPALIRKILPQRTKQALAVSKYVLGCDKTAFLSRNL